jgi:DNA-binding CsgD family transcriptional regulator
MSNEAWNKIDQTHDLFKKIIAPLKQHLGINFGYMIVFKDGSYYQIIEDLECLKKWVINVETSSIFCARNVTNYFDGGYNFTLWPEDSMSPAMDIYHEYSILKGITVSKMSKHYTELYWFTREIAEIDWHKLLIRNKIGLLEFIKYFDAHEKLLFIPKNNTQQELFKFNQGFDLNLQESEYVKEEFLALKRMISSLQSDHMIINKIQKKINLSPREIEVLSIICRGYTTKIIAQKLDISVKTVQYYIEHIKVKTGLHFKSDIIKFYEDCFYKI